MDKYFLHLKYYCFVKLGKDDITLNYLRCFSDNIILQDIFFNLQIFLHVFMCLLYNIKPW